MVFILSALWGIRIRGFWKLPDRREGLRRKLGLVLMGGAMFSKSLIQFYVAGWGCVPSLLFQIRSVAQSDSLRPHESQHARPPCPSPTPGVYSNSCPSSLWCHPTISSSVVPFSSRLRSFPASGSFPVSQLFSIRWPEYWSFSFSIIPSKETPGLISFRMDWLDLLAVQGTLKSLLQHHSSKASIFRHSAFLYSLTLTSIHGYWKNHSFDYGDLCQ